MKKALVVLAGVAMCATGYSQGLINFANRNVPKAIGDGTTYNIPFFTPGGRASNTGAGTLAGGVHVALFTPDGLTKLAETTLRTDTPANAAFFGGVGPSAITDIDTHLGIGATPTLIVRAYDGSSFATAVNKLEVSFTTKPLGGTPAGAPPIATPGLTGLGSETGTGFELTVPEPSTIALGAIGIGALLLRRRK